jgi:hypothetical protein
MAGKINNQKIKSLIDKGTIFRIYFALKKVWKINCEKNKGLTVKDLGFIFLKEIP